jgi:hypothetical protein
MRIGIIIAGILIAALSIAAVSGGLHYKEDKEVLRVGDLSAKTEETRGVPQWLGMAGILIGAVLVVGGATRRTT